MRQEFNTRLLLEQGAEPAILVDAIDATYRELGERGVELAGALHMIHRDGPGHFGPAGSEEWMALFHDSEGNPVGLVERRTLEP